MTRYIDGLTATPTLALPRKRGRENRWRGRGLGELGDACR
jgi:hypothetical protein